MTRRSSPFLVLLLPLALTALASSCKSSRPGAAPPPPTVTWEAPTGASTLHGAVSVVVSATGATPLSSLRILEPAGLADATPVFDGATKTGRISTTLDLSSFSDGPLTLLATATDDGGRTSSQSITVTVAQTVPTITLVTPANTGAALSGNAVLLTVSASAANGSTITQLELVNPPAGVGANTSPSASLFTAVWNTTQALEGSTSLHFRATDSTGLVGDRTYVVTVDNVPLGTFDVRVSPGSPVAGATVTVYAIDDATGAVKTSVGTNGVLGTNGPTDAAGRVLVTLSAENYAGPVRVVASGTSLQYVDPGLAAPLTNISIPSSFTFTSLLANYATGSGVVIPLTLWTTLADHEALAVAAGKHPDHAGTRPVSQALAMRDALFVSHIVNSGTAWPLTSLRTTVPAPLNVGATTLVDSVYAALFDVALNVLGHDVAARAGYSYSSTTINAITLTQLLEQDLDADGQFDGKGESGATLVTSGATPVTLDAQLLRVPLATALDTFIYDTALNKTGLTRNDLANAGVYDTISSDASDLFGAPPSGTFDNAGPTNTVALTYSLPSGPTGATPVGLQKFVAGTLTITVDAADASGVTAIVVTANGNAVSPGAGSTSSHFVGTWSTTSVGDGPLTVQVTSTDSRHNTSVTSVGGIIDNTVPTLLVTAPSSAAYYSTSVPFDVSATDAGAGVASLTSTGFAGLSDLDGTVAHLAAAWNTPAATPDGVLTGQLTSCDLVGNCLAQSLPITFDNTAPSLAPTASVPTYASTAEILLTFTASDAGSGVSALKSRLNGASKPDLIYNGASNTYSGTFPLLPGSNTITVWGTDLATNANGSAPNSGDGQASPFSRTYTILQDNEAPAPYRDAAVGSYYDERNMTLASAAMPPVFTWPGTPTKVEPIAAGGVYKTSIRVAWTTPPTPAVLEAANPDNIPFIRIGCPITANTAPLTTATYSVSLNGGSPVTGDLAPWLSPTSTATLNNYDLPIAANLFPALSTLQGAIAASIDVSFTDAANNVGTLHLTTTIHVIGPPLWVEEDTTWPTNNSGTYAYTYAGGSYGGAWPTSSTATTRLQKYVLSNPYPVSVAVTVGYTQAAASWTPIETYNAALDPTLVPVEDGVNYVHWDTPPGAYMLFNYAYFWYGDAHGIPWHSHRSASGSSFYPSTIYPCAPALWPSSGRPRHRWDDAVNLWTPRPDGSLCYPNNTADYVFTARELTPAVADITPVLYRDPISTGTETLPPQFGGGYYTIPAADAYGPGQLTVYLTRPLGLARDAEMTLMPWAAASSSYTGIFETVYAITKVGSAAESGTQHHSRRTMTAAREVLAGTLLLNTVGRVAATTYGEPSTASVPVNKTITH